LSILFIIISSVAIYPADKKTIGVIIPESLKDYKESHEAFIKRLRMDGYDNTKLDIYIQSPNPDPISWMNSIRKFVAHDIDIMVIYGASPLMIATKETKKPIIFADVYDPDKLGILKRANNITGISSKVPLATLIETLKNIKPFKILGVIYNSNEKDSVIELNEIKKLKSVYNFDIIEIDIRKPSDIESSLKMIYKVEAIYISSSILVNLYVDRILPVINQNNIPTMGILSSLAEKGVIINLVADPKEQGEKSALKTIEILNGGDISKIPIDKSKKVNLIINIKSAKAMGLNIPFEVLTKATKVIK